MLRKYGAGASPTGAPGSKKRTSVSSSRISDLIAKEVQQLPCWINPSVLPKGGTLLYGGPPKIGKTFVGISTARSLATGKPLFECNDFLVPRPTKVLLVDQELGEIGLKKRVVPAFQNLKPEEYEENFWYVSKTPELLLNEPNGKKILWQLVEETQPEVLILDPLGQIHGFNENDNTEIGELFTILDQLKSDFSHLGLSLVIAHHFGKPLRGRDAADYDPLDPQNFRGSSRFFGNPDSIVTMERQANLVASHTAWGLKARFTLRHGEEVPDMFLTVNENRDGLVRWKSNVGGAIPKLPSTRLPSFAPPTSKGESNGSSGPTPRGFAAL